MCKKTCNKCNQCADICSCRAKLEPCATTSCKEKISTDCIWYRFGNQSSMSNLLCFLGVPNNTNLTTILEKLDSKLCGLYKLNPNSCARQLLGLPVTTDIIYVMGKILDYICTIQDVKVKVSETDLSGGYLADQIEVGDCLVKTITQDLAGNQKLKLSIDYNCLKSKIPTCIEVNCSECSQNTCVKPVFGTPTVVCQGNNIIVNVSVTSPAFALIQFSSDEGITWVNGNPNSHTFTFASSGVLQKIKARVAGCTVYADGYVQLCTVAPSPTAPSPSPAAPSPASPVAPTTPTAPSPVSPSPSPVAPTTPVAPSPTAPSPVAPSPVAPSPVAPSPVAPTAPSPSALCNYFNIQNSSSNTYNYTYPTNSGTQSGILLGNTTVNICTSGGISSIVLVSTSTPVITLSGVSLLGTSTCACSSAPSPSPSPVVPSPVAPTCYNICLTNEDATVHTARYKNSTGSVVTINVNGGATVCVVSNSDSSTYTVFDLTAGNDWDGGSLTTLTYSNISCP